MIINQDEIPHQSYWLIKCRMQRSSSTHRSPFVTTNFPSRFFLKLKVGSKDSATPYASFILTRKYFFIVSFMSICILLSRYSNNRNLNIWWFTEKSVCLVACWLKKCFLFCFYVRDNRVFPKKSPPVDFLLINILFPPLHPYTKNPPLNNLYFLVITQSKLYF